MQLSHEVEKKGDSELLHALLFDFQRHSRMAQMEPFPSCAGMSRIAQHQCVDGLAQGCATHGPRATIRPSRPVNVALDDGRTKKNFFLNRFI